MADPTGSGTSPSDSEVAEEQQRLLATRGYAFSEFEWLAKIDPEYEKARLAYTKMIYAREDPVLPIKTREIIASIVLASRGHRSIGPHIRRALREGATMREIVEAFEVATVPGGFPVLHFALPFLIEIDQEQQAAKGG